MKIYKPIHNQQNQDTQSQQGQVLSSEAQVVAPEIPSPVMRRVSESTARRLEHRMPARYGSQVFNPQSTLQTGYAGGKANKKKDKLKKEK